MGFERCGQHPYSPGSRAASVGTVAREPGAAPTPPRIHPRPAPMCGVQAFPMPRVSRRETLKRACLTSCTRKNQLAPRARFMRHSNVDAAHRQSAALCAGPPHPPIETRSASTTWPVSYCQQNPSPPTATPPHPLPLDALPTSWRVLLASSAGRLLVACRLWTQAMAIPCPLQCALVAADAVNGWPVTGRAAAATSAHYLRIEQHRQAHRPIGP